MKSLLLTAAVIMGFTSASLAQNLPGYVPTNGLVGWWPFNGNANDESGNGNNGTVNNSTLTADRSGNSNNAYSFDGVDDWILIPSSSSLDNISLVTFNFWMKSSQQTNAQLFKKGNSGVSSSFEQLSFQININSQNQSGFATKYNSNCVPGDGWLNNYSNYNVTDNNWYMITGVIKTDSTLYYINGSLISSVPTPNSSMDICNGGAINLGRNWNNDPDQYLGVLDDIGIWNRALNQEEISNLYNTTITGFSSPFEANTIKVFPNPASDHITIDYGNFAFTNGYNLKIENFLGQPVFQTRISQQSDKISLSNWGGNGLYFVKICDSQGNTIATRKIVLAP
jgi:hypothetical protein